MLTALAIAGATAAPRAQNEEAPAVSLDRVRAALQRGPSKLVWEERKPDFTVRVVWQHPFHEIFDSPPWLLPKAGWQPPGVGLNLLSVFSAMSKAASNAKRERDERAAREEVQQAIFDYCAAQPDQTRAQVCTIVPIVR